MHATCGSVSGESVSEATHQARAFGHYPFTSFPLCPSANLNLGAVPEFRIYKFWEAPVGPHPVAMFEVNVFTPLQFGTFISWLAVHRGPLSVLIHPNCLAAEGESEVEAALRDHSERAIWMGERLPLDYSVFFRAIEAGKSG